MFFVGRSAQGIGIETSLNGGKAKNIQGFTYERLSGPVTADTSSSTTIIQPFLMRRLLLLIALLVSGAAFGQVDTSALRTKAASIQLQLGAGYNVSFYNWNTATHGKAFVDIGVARMNSGRIGRLAVRRHLFLATEIYHDSATVVAPKIGMWVARKRIGFGITALYFTDFHLGRCVLRPEVGYAKRSFRIYYGLNLLLPQSRYYPIKNHLLGYSGIPHHVIAATFWIGKSKR